MVRCCHHATRDVAETESSSLNAEQGMLKAEIMEVIGEAPDGEVRRCGNCPRMATGGVRTAAGGHAECKFDLMISSPQWSARMADRPLMSLY